MRTPNGWRLRRVYWMMILSSIRTGIYSLNPGRAGFGLPTDCRNSTSMHLSSFARKLPNSQPAVRLRAMGEDIC